MKYRINTGCPRCGRWYSYMSDDSPEKRECPFASTHTSVEEKPRKRCPDNLPKR